MKAPLKVISELGCPTDSYIAAVQYLLRQPVVDKPVYEARVQEIIGLAERPETESWYTAKILFIYVVQELLRTLHAGITVTTVIDDEFMLNIYRNAKNRTDIYVQENPWNETRFNIEQGLRPAESEESADPTDETNLTPSVKKGAKKDVTERLFKDLKTSGASRQKIIDSFMEHVGMSKAGATTYFHALKKEFGFSEKDNPETETLKAESKQDFAERLYNESVSKDKVILIALFTEKLQTSKLGAQTYYYACKKKYNEKHINDGSVLHTSN